MSGEAIVAEARRWIGTPYRHRGRMRLAGCDCLGLVLGVWRDLGGMPPEDIPIYRPGWDTQDSQERLLSAASDMLMPARTSEVLPGQVLVFRMRRGRAARHIGIAARTDEGPSLIHAYSGHGVVESPLSAPWRRRIAARFEFPTGE